MRQESHWSTATPSFTYQSLACNLDIDSDSDISKGFNKVARFSHNYFLIRSEGWPSSFVLGIETLDTLQPTGSI